jgi:hypothetical protein
MQTLCGLFGKSRQAWYDMPKRHTNEDMQGAIRIAKEVKRLGIDLPSIGVDVLHFELTDFREQHGIKTGREKLSNLLRDNELLIIRSSRRVKTARSHRRYFNTLRPHSRCNYHPPAQAHQMKGELKRRWQKCKPRSMEKAQEKESIFVTRNEC